MTAPEPSRLAAGSDIEAVDALLDVGGLSLVDAGCGAGDLARALAARGAEVVAIDPDPAQAAANAAAEPVAGVTFAQAPAQEMPLAAGTVDGVVFSRSLHHVPAPSMDAALREVLRVVKPGTGFLLVLEPEPWGTYHDLIKPFHDETAARRLARAALDRVAAGGFATCETYAYETQTAYARFEDFRDRYANASYLEYAIEDVDSARVRRTFDAAFDGAAYRFTTPHWIALYRGAR